jgi:hypothetical protein
MFAFVFHSFMFKLSFNTNFATKQNSNNMQLYMSIGHQYKSKSFQIKIL